MDDDDYTNPDSEQWAIYWDTLKKMKEIGFHRIAIPEDLGGEDANPEQTHVIMEELGWGSSGFPSLSE